jgi:carboxymethylenebutenolidase
MPVYEPDHVEYTTVSGHIGIMLEDGTNLPAFWAHPSIGGGRFPGVVLIPDWWGITNLERQLAITFAQAGYYVIVPDLYDGVVATTPQEAKIQVERLGEGGGYPRVDCALRVLETHHRCNCQVAAVGVGMGGSLAYEAALTRDDLEAAVSFCGFPQRYLGRFASVKAPVLAFYGTRDPYVKNDVLRQLRKELDASPLAPKHEVVMLDGAGRNFLATDTPEMQAYGNTVWRKTLRFLSQHLMPVVAKPARKTY